MEEKAKAPFWKPALIYGLIVGFVSILVSVIFYLFDLYLARWTNWVNLGISVVVLAYVLVAYRNEYLGGTASYGKIFRMAFVIGIISAILGTVYTYLMWGVIDPELADRARVMAEERIMSNPRIPESMYDDIMERMERNFGLTRMTILGFVSGVIFNTILALIVSAFVKKEVKTLSQVS